MPLFFLHSTIPLLFKPLAIFCSVQPGGWKPQRQVFLWRRSYINRFTIMTYPFIFRYIYTMQTSCSTISKQSDLHPVQSGFFHNWHDKTQVDILLSQKRSDQAILTKFRMPGIQTGFPLFVLSCYLSNIRAVS